MLKTNKLIKATSVMLVLTCVTVLLFTSCNNDNKSNKNQVVIDIPKDNSGLDTIDHFISDATIGRYKKEFKIQQDSLGIKYPSLFVPDAEAFNKRSLLSLLKAPDCVGIRIYHGVKSGKRNEIRLILVGVDSKGKDILIDKTSIIAAKITDDMGGLESGQCPPCITGQDQ